MQLARIISLIDAYLDRLIKARLVLTTLIPSGGERRKTPMPPRAHSRKQNPVSRDTSPAFVPHRGEQSVSPLQKTKSVVQEKMVKKAKVVARRKNSAVSVILEPVPIPDKQTSQRQPEEHGAQKVVDASNLTQVAKFSPTLTVRPSRKRQTMRKPPIASVSTALSGLVPAGPVFIPAAQIRHERSLKQQVSAMERELLGPAAVPLTVELLSQRWIQDSTS
jgi:hypothetical protein